MRFRRLERQARNAWQMGRTEVLREGCPYPEADRRRDRWLAVSDRERTCRLTLMPQAWAAASTPACRYGAMASGGASNCRRGKRCGDARG
jgi:ribosome modulation factor